MGLALRLNLFHDVDAPDVFGALAEFYGNRGDPCTGDADAVAACFPELLLPTSNLTWSNDLGRRT